MWEIFPCLTDYRWEKYEVAKILPVDENNDPWAMITSYGIHAQIGENDEK